MKSVKQYFFALIFGFQLLAHCFIAGAQQKEDVVVLLNGERKTGKVVAVSDDAIKFVYSGENLEYEFKKANINQIEFASGRTEVFNVQNAADQSATGEKQRMASADRKNKIAVLPFEIVSNDPSLTTEAMGKEIQSACVAAIRGESSFMQVQDPRTSNAILTKNNIKMVDVSNLAPGEVADLLGVEYVLFGTYDIQNEGTMTSGSGVTTYKTDKKDDKRKGTEVSSQNAYTTTTYNTKVGLSLYNDAGESVFSETKKPLLGSLNSYQGAIKYLAKRMPFGSKAKK